MSKSKKNAEDNGREAAKSARTVWGRGWQRLSHFQRCDAEAGELLLTIESMTEEVLVEQFGECALPGFQVIKQMIAAMQETL